MVLSVGRAVIVEKAAFPIPILIYVSDSDKMVRAKPLKVNKFVVRGRFEAQDSFLDAELYMLGPRGNVVKLWRKMLRPNQPFSFDAELPTSFFVPGIQVFVLYPQGSGIATPTVSIDLSVEVDWDAGVPAQGR